MIANANALLAATSATNQTPVIENEFTVTTGWFNTPSGKFGTGNRQVVNLNLADNAGANNGGYGSAINLDAQSGNGNRTDAGERVKNVFMAEWSEILMSIAGNWHAGDSGSDGMSQFCSIQRFQTGHYSYYGSWVESWLNTGGQAYSANNQKWVASPNAARWKWVTQTFTGVTTAAGDQIHGDGDAVSFGCALAFLYYLYNQLGFTVNQIIVSYNSNLMSIYNALTGDSGNPFPVFRSSARARLSFLEHRESARPSHRQSVPSGTSVFLGG